MEIFSFILIMLLAIGFHCKGEKPYIELGSSFYLDVVKSSAFVDKTLLIKQIFKSRFTLLTAPRRFGKSTNLDMLNTFLSILLSSRDKDKRLQIFQRLKIYKESPEFVNQTFGSYAVLYVDLKINRSVENCNDAVKILAVKVHESYLKHEYLRSSIMLEGEDRETCTLWCEKRSYLRKVKSGLKNLAKFLFKHYNNNKVSLLVDEYDAIISDTMFTVSKTELNKIIGLNINQISDLIKSNNHVDRAVITGISYIIARSGISGMNNLDIYKFLDDHYVSFYGFLEEEVNSLFTKFNVRTKEAADAHDWYGGYICKKGRSIYSTYSILNFLQKGKVKSYWTRSGRVEELKEIFRYNPIENMVRQMLGGECVEIDLDTDITVSDISELRYATCF